MRLVLIFAGLLLAVSCQRDYPAGHPAQTATATSVWDLLEIELPERDLAQSAPSTAAAETPIEPVPELGPAFSDTDTVDVALLPGAWLQFCQTLDEQISPLPADRMDVVELDASGQMVWHFVNDGKDNPQSGWWEKTAPGVVTFALGEQPGNEFRLQMFGEDFFFFWNYASAVGMWFARLPQEAPPAIAHNRFSSNLGDFRFDSVNENMFEGTAAGEYERTIFGIYTRGVLIMRWEEPQTNAAGYAAFTVKPDWQLDGVWWIDDYQAAPFGGPYTATPQT